MQRLTRPLWPRVAAAVVPVGTRTPLASSIASNRWLSRPAEIEVPEAERREPSVGGKLPAPPKRGRSKLDLPLAHPEEEASLSVLPVKAQAGAGELVEHEGPALLTTDYVSPPAMTSAESAAMQNPGTQVGTWVPEGGGRWLEISPEAMPAKLLLSEMEPMVTPRARDHRHPIMQWSNVEGEFPGEAAGLLACPVSKAPLEFDDSGEWLVCRESNLKYPVVDGIPLLLMSEAEQWRKHGEGE